MDKVQGLRYKRTLFVGLGGAGAKTLRSLKRKIIRANGEVPPQVKFLLIDTNATELANLRDFDSSEKVCIAVREPYYRYEHDQKNGLDTHEFIPLRNAHSLLALERGAGQIRSNGHFAVIENQYSKKLSRVFRHCADKLEDIDIDADTLEKDPKIEVRLVFSIAGGTGSGTFLPISVILRDAIQHCELTAYIYSATHFEKKVENSAKYSVMQNAYAALCELDYMMHFGRNNKKYSPITFNFGPDVNQKIEQVNRPFEEVYYIDKSTSLPVPESVEFAYNELDRLQDNTADAMFLAATNIITAHTGTVDNVRQKILEGQFDVSDKFAWVSGLGLSEIFFKTANSDHPAVKKECRESLKARITGELDKKIIDEIATGFIRCYKWDESDGPNDGDPVLRAIYDDINERSKLIIKELVDINKLDNKPYTEDKITLDTILKHHAECNSARKVEDCVDRFKSQLHELVVSLIDKDEYSTEEDGIILTPKVKGYDGTGNGLSLPVIQKILSAIEKSLQRSIETLTEEENEFGKLEEEAGKITPSNDNSEEQKDEEKNIEEKEVITLQFDESPHIRKRKVKAIHYAILKERTEKAIQVFEDSKSFVEDEKRTLSLWCNVLQTAYEEAQKSTSENEDKEKKNNAQRKSNSIEVSSLDLKDFRLSYNYIQNLYKDFKADKFAADSSIFKNVCVHFVCSRGSLQSYLVDGITSIKKRANSEEIKLEKTECQKKIEQLIDLASPTMQVNRHGYGEQIKVDQFWYIMTDCPEENIIDKPKNNGTKDDEKSVGALLKELIEQNTLEARVNLVHVPGWKNKAVLYRVKSAVPVYFVDGVCTSGVGSFTLEGCYEELKKTKRTYTPFSHETLRQKLEHRVNALKPMDMVSDSKTLDYWINFILLEFVQKRGGSYCIDSQSCGERYSSNLLCRNNVLVLGDTRAEAYETFQRYCGELLKERNDAYNKRIKDFKSFGEIGNVSACDYVENKDLCLYDKELIEQLDPDDPDFVQLDREIKHLEARYKKFIEEKKIKEHNEAVANCGSESCGKYKNQTKSK